MIVATGKDAGWTNECSRGKAFEILKDKKGNITGYKAIDETTEKDPTLDPDGERRYKGSPNHNLR